MEGRKGGENRRERARKGGEDRREGKEKEERRERGMRKE